MRTYRPQLNWDDDMRTNVPSRTVVELEPTQHFSGLLDADGNKLMVSLQTGPIGFVVFSERS